MDRERRGVSNPTPQPTQKQSRRNSQHNNQPDDATKTTTSPTTQPPQQQQQKQQQQQATTTVTTTTTTTTTTTPTTPTTKTATKATKPPTQQSTQRRRCAADVLWEWRTDALRMPISSCSCCNTLSSAAINSWRRLHGCRSLVLHTKCSHEEIGHACGGLRWKHWKGWRWRRWQSFSLLREEREMGHRRMTYK